MKRLFIPDTHLGFCNMDLLHEVYKFNQKFKANEVYQLGDFVDFYSFSTFIKQPDAPSPAEEFKRTKSQVAQFCKWFPKTKILMGNHEKRIFKRAAEVGISRFWLRNILEVLEATKGVTYHDRDYLDIDDKTVIVHGHLSSQNAKKTHMDFYRKNTVHGHIHNQLGIEFNARSRDKIWGMSCSCIVDKDSVAMRYSEQDYKNIICGFGYEVDGKPFVECLG